MESIYQSIAAIDQGKYFFFLQFNAKTILLTFLKKKSDLNIKELKRILTHKTRTSFSPYRSRFGPCF